MVLYPDVITPDDAAALAALRAPRRQARGRGRAAEALARTRSCPIRRAGAERPLGVDAGARPAARDLGRAHASPPASPAASLAPARPLPAVGDATSALVAVGAGSAPAGRCCSPMPARSSTAASTCATTRLFALASPARDGRSRSSRACTATGARAAGAPCPGASAARSCCWPWQAPRSCWRAAGASGRRSRPGGQLAPARSEYAEGLAGALAAARDPAEAPSRPVVGEARSLLLAARGRRRRRAARGRACAPG